MSLVFSDLLCINQTTIWTQQFPVITNRVLVSLWARSECCWHEMPHLLRHLLIWRKLHFHTNSDKIFYFFSQTLIDYCLSSFMMVHSMSSAQFSIAQDMYPYIIQLCCRGLLEPDPACVGSESVWWVLFDLWYNLLHITHIQYRQTSTFTFIPEFTACIMSHLTSSASVTPVGWTGAPQTL